MDPQSYQDGAYPVLDQQQHLLYPTGFSPVTTPTHYHVVDQIERGGAHVEEILNRFNCHYQSLFFLASWSVIFASILGIFASVFSFEITTVFGSAVLMLDIPGNPLWASKYRKYIRKYAKLLTRLTGKSLWFLYLGCMIISCLWPNSRRRTSSIFLLFTLLLSAFVNCTACLGLFIALRKSLRLEKVRKSLLNTYQGNWPDVYRKYAVNDPAHGMQFDEFNRMASDYSHGKLLFDLTDLRIIYNALDEHQKCAINEIEFGQWVSSGLLDENDSYGCMHISFSMIYL